jgi:hypothetical protein
LNEEYGIEQARALLPDEFALTITFDYFESRGEYVPGPVPELSSLTRHGKKPLAKDGSLIVY